MLVLALVIEKMESSAMSFFDYDYEHEHDYEHPLNKDKIP